MNIIIIGTGMYSSGIGTNEYGTIFPAIVEWSKKTSMKNSISVIGTSSKNTLKAKKKIFRTV